jgi:membrane protein DedA with SNARE-associated domain
MFARIEELVVEMAGLVPLEVFIFLGSIIEEVVAPIPSPTVMVLAGSFALLEGRSVMGLIPLALVGALGKTIGALCVYYIADHAEDYFMKFFGRFFSISHEDIEKLGNKLGRGARDYVILTFLRALPIMPSVIVSAGGGLLKVALPLFIISTFLGTIIRDGVYLYAGFLGTDALKKFVATSSHLEKYVEIFVGVLLCALIFYLFQKKWKK